MGLRYPASQHRRWMSQSMRGPSNWTHIGVVDKTFANIAVLSRHHLPGMFNVIFHEQSNDKAEAEEWAPNRTSRKKLHDARHSKLERAQNGILSRALGLELTVGSWYAPFTFAQEQKSGAWGRKGEELAGCTVCTRELRSGHDGCGISYRLLESPPASGSYKAGCARHENYKSESRWKEYNGICWQVSQSEARDGQN
jgi:hypothetical protein